MLEINIRMSRQATSFNDNVATYNNVQYPSDDVCGRRSAINLLFAHTVIALHTISAVIAYVH